MHMVQSDIFCRWFGKRLVERLVTKASRRWPDSGCPRECNRTGRWGSRASRRPDPNSRQRGAPSGLCREAHSIHDVPFARATILLRRTFRVAGTGPQWPNDRGGSGATPSRGLDPPPQSKSNRLEALWRQYVAFSAQDLLSRPEAIAQCTVVFPPEAFPAGIR